MQTNNTHNTELNNMQEFKLVLQHSTSANTPALYNTLVQNGFEYAYSTDEGSLYEIEGTDDECIDAAIAVEDALFNNTDVTDITLYNSKLSTVYYKDERAL